MNIALKEYCNDDLWLTEKLELNPEIMGDMGGPTPKDVLRRAHHQRVRAVAGRFAWYFTIVPDGVDQPVGTVGIWPTELLHSPINEMGWMVLPEYQGHGYGTAAAREALSRARFEQRWRLIHALPCVSNMPSNAICKRLGFSLNGEIQLAYRNQTLWANDWVIELFPPPC